MNILAIDTATEVCSVALLGQDLRAELLDDASPQASRIVLGMLDDLMRQASTEWRDIGLLTFGQGPGSFTGVRVATGLVQGLALGHGLPVMGISTLEAVAWAAKQQAGSPDRPVLAALDARMQELYWACYQRDGSGALVALGEERVGRPGEIALPFAGEWLAAGSAESAYGQLLQEHLAGCHLEWLSGIVPRALSMAELAAQRLAQGETGCSAEQVRPVYLRHRVVHR